MAHRAIAQSKEVCIMIGGVVVVPPLSELTGLTAFTFTFVSV
jgi:hypothetical protein